MGTGSPQVDPIAAHRHTLIAEQFPLAPSHRDGAVGAHDPMPRKILVCRGQQAPDESRRRGIDVAIGLHETQGNSPDPVDDACEARLMTLRQPAAGTAHRSDHVRRLKPVEGRRR